MISTLHWNFIHISSCKIWLFRLWITFRVNFALGKLNELIECGELKSFIFLQKWILPLIGRTVTVTESILDELLNQMNFTAKSNATAIMSTQNWDHPLISNWINNWKKQRNNNNHTFYQCYQNVRLEMLIKVISEIPHENMSWRNCRELVITHFASIENVFSNVNR